MLLSAQQFAVSLPELRAQLHAFLARKGSYSPEDAEDLVEDAVCIALEHLPDYRAETGDRGLWLWLRGILNIVLARFHRAAGHTVATVPLEAAAELPAPPPSVRPDRVIRQRVNELPPGHRDIVRWWLDGYAISEISAYIRLHRSTVSARIQDACSLWRAEVDIIETGGWLRSDFDFCRRQVVYHKPVGVWQSWRRRHPSDRVLFGNAYRRPSIRSIRPIPLRKAA